MKWFGMLAVVAMISLSSFAVEKDAKDAAVKAEHEKGRTEESSDRREASKKSKSDAKSAKGACEVER